MSLEKTRAALNKLGYSSQGIEYMIKEIQKVLAKYSDPRRAEELFDENFSKNVHSRFGEHKFRNFLKGIDPKSRRSLQMAELSEDVMEEMTPVEIQDWNKERNAPDLNHLADVWEYEVLCSQHFRSSKKDQIDLERLPKARFISVPMGGQPKKK